MFCVVLGKGSITELQPQPRNQQKQKQNDNEGQLTSCSRPSKTQRMTSGCGMEGVLGDPPSQVSGMPPTPALHRQVPETHSILEHQLF